MRFRFGPSPRDSGAIFVPAWHGIEAPDWARWRVAVRAVTTGGAVAPRPAAATAP